jgi:hypothetical protein
MLSVLKFCVRRNKAVAIGWKPTVMFRVNGLFLLLSAWELSIVGVRAWAVVGFNGRSL